MLAPALGGDRVLLEAHGPLGRHGRRELDDRGAVRDLGARGRTSSGRRSSCPSERRRGEARAARGRPRGRLGRVVRRQRPRRGVGHGRGDFADACVFEGDAGAVRADGLHARTCSSPGSRAGCTTARPTRGLPRALRRVPADRRGRGAPLQAWDFVHCPWGTEHIFVGAGDGPCVIFMAGARAHRERVCRRPGAALRHGAGVETETSGRAMPTPCSTAVAARPAGQLRRAALERVTRVVAARRARCDASAAATAGRLARESRRRFRSATGHVSTSPKVGYVYSCMTRFGGIGGAQVGPWIDAAAEDVGPDREDHRRRRREVAAARTREGRRLGARSAFNDLPIGTRRALSGASSGPAYAYDRNPNPIAAQSVSWSLPLSPKAAARLACTPGPGRHPERRRFLYNALDGEGRDAAAHEVLDLCGGHPDPSSSYHHHDVPTCLVAKRSERRRHTRRLRARRLRHLRRQRRRRHSADERGARRVSRDDEHVTWDGKPARIYHYVATLEYPYSVGCSTAPRSPAAAAARPAAPSRPVAGTPFAAFASLEAGHAAPSSAVSSRPSLCSCSWSCPPRRRR